MLSYPDRTKFEQIRARWEAAEQGGSDAADMGGKKEKQPLHAPGSGGPSQHANKFRRKLSHGLAFIANPLSQRKSVSGRQLASNPSLAVVAPSADEAKLSPLQDSAPEIPSQPRSQNVPADLTTLPQPEDPDQTPKPLPRSRTVSYIPRPVRSVSGSSIQDTESVTILRSPTMADLRVHAYSKIPSPSPSLSKRRVSSPRQYVSTQQMKETASVRSTAANANDSPTKRSFRSRTTPNLVDMVHSSQTEGRPTPRASGLGRLRATSDRKSMLQENVPTSKRILRNHSQVHSTASKRDSLSVPTTVMNRRSLGPGTLVAQNKQQMPTTPSVPNFSGLYVGSRAPIANENIRPNDVKDVKSSEPSHSNKMSTPSISSSVEADGSCSTTDSRVQKKSRKPSNGARVPTDATHQVSQLPSSSTFHHFGRNWQTIPSLPQIVEKYGSTSVSDLGQMQAVEAKDFLSDETSTGPSYPVCDKSPKRRYPILEAKSSERLVELDNDSTDLLLSVETNTLSDTASVPSVPAGPLIKRDWSIHDTYTSDYADCDLFLQVYEHMPAPWWAGRFQSRFDQWRTAAMSVQLNPNVKHELTGPLCGYSIDQEKLAAAYILRQLRDLCQTDQAADSLWDFEYKYRRDNQLPTTSIHIPQPPRKSEDQTNQKGAFGRAVRKMTPRKSSLVNLLKGKGWNNDVGDMKSESMHNLWAAPSNE